MTTAKSTLGYCRSAYAQNGDKTATDTQRRKLEKFAKEQGLVIDRFYVDVGVSGNTLKRPAFKQLMHDCKVGNVRTILVADFDRIAREITLKVNALATFKELGITVTSVTENGWGDQSFFGTLFGAAKELKQL